MAAYIDANITAHGELMSVASYETSTLTTMQ